MKKEIDFTNDFENQVAVITGASSGIGKAIAIYLSRHLVTPCLVGRDIKTLQKVSEITEKGAPRTRIYKADLAVDGDIQKLRDSIASDFAHIDILIHCAGIFSMGRLESTPVDELDRQFKTNVRAPYLLSQFMLPMMKSRQGQIVFINSSVGLKTRGNIGQYAASKHALKATADSLRDEVNLEGIRVLSVYLGRTATPMQELMHHIEQKSYKPEILIQPEDVADVVVNALALPWTAEVTDIHMRPMKRNMHKILQT
jgi:short-subunit dehydrogenase